MAIDEVNVEIKIDGLDLTEGAEQPDPSGGGNADTLENVRKDLEGLRGEFAASVNDAVAGRKDLSEVRESVTKVKERLDEWEKNAQMLQEMARRLKGVDGPSDATRRKMALP